MHVFQKVIYRALLCIISLSLIPGIAEAGTSMSAEPVFPEIMTEGTVVPVQYRLTNTSDAFDAEVLLLLHTHLDAYCTSSASTHCLAPDANTVFQLPATGVGTGACNGVTFDLLPAGVCDGTVDVPCTDNTDCTGIGTETCNISPGTVILEPQNTVYIPRYDGHFEEICTVDFSVQVSSVPATDVFTPVPPGVQTFQLGHAVGEAVNVCVETNVITGALEVITPVTPCTPGAACIGGRCSDGIAGLPASGTGTDSTTVEPGDTTTVPTLNTWGLAIFVLLAGALSILSLYRREQR